MSYIVFQISNFKIYLMHLFPLSFNSKFKQDTGIMILKII